MSSVLNPIQTMPEKLARAFSALDIGIISLLKDNGEKDRDISPKEHAIALFLYLDLAGMIENENRTYRFMIIAEQPYSVRMAKQVQRAFNMQIEAENLNGAIRIEVEGVGPGIKEEELSKEVLSRVNSELGALMAERYVDARSNLLQENPSLRLRDSKILMFSTRDEQYRELTQAEAAVNELEFSGLRM